MCVKGLIITLAIIDANNNLKLIYLDLGSNTELLIASPDLTTADFGLFYKPLRRFLILTDESIVMG